MKDDEHIAMVIRSAVIAHNILRVVTSRTKMQVMAAVNTALEELVLMKEAIKKMEE